MKGSEIDWRSIEGRSVVESQGGSPYGADMKVHEVEVNAVGNVTLSEREAYTNDQPYADALYFLLPPMKEPTHD